MAQDKYKKGDRNGTPGQRRRWLRILIACIAVVAIAFCAWSMSQYVQGQDPLAWLLGQPALQTTAQSAADNTSDNTADDSAAATDNTAATSPSTVSKDDVAAAIESLTWDGEDVGCSAEDFRVVLKADAGIWVEQTSDVASQDMVDGTAKRLAALSAWVRDNHVDAPRVTWITEDAQGYIRMIVAADPETMVTSGSASDILAASSSYAIAYADYTASSSDEGIAQTKGETPTYPSGDQASVATTEQEADDQAQQVAQTEAQSQSDPGSSGSSSQSSSGASSSSGGASPQAAPAAAQSVSVSVDGSAAGGGSHGGAVAYRDGMTAYDALVAADGNVNARGTQFGTYVAAIDGLAEKEHGSMSGWVYAVNGVEPNTACSNYVLSAGDTVTWTYVNVEY